MSLLGWLFKQLISQNVCDFVKKKSYFESENEGNALEPFHKQTK